MDNDQHLPTPGNSSGSGAASGADTCAVCNELANENFTGQTSTCGLPAHRLIEGLHRIIQDGARAEAQLRRQITNITQQFNTDRAQLRREAQQHLERIENLEARLGKRGQHTKRTWQQLVRAHLQQPDPDMTWEMIYKQCCKEENMSVSLDWIHPNIRLQGPDIAGQPRIEAENPTPVPEVPFPFERLPWKVQARIFEIWLWKPGQLIHALSRLDKYVELVAIPDEEDLQHSSGLPRGFYWGKTHYSVTDDRRDPNDVLRVLLVSKRFFFLGVHCFYGLNTFAFSSLGEFDRFCNGTGEARNARLQHIEMTWQGSQYLTLPPIINENGEAMGMSQSRRTYGLYALQDLYRLRTLVVHVNETGNIYIRRRYEPGNVKEYMTRKTQGQPNQRMTRSLRCLQGLDRIHQLRGLQWIRFYDLRKAFAEGRKNTWTGERVDITDWSFMEDVTNVTTMQKMPSRLETSKLERLPCLFRNEDAFVPTEEDWNIVKGWYIDEGGRGSYDHLRRLGQHLDADIPSNPSSTSRADSDVSSESDSDSDSDGDSRPPARPRPKTPRGRIRLRNSQRRPEPSIAQLLMEIRNGEDSDSSESDDSDSDLESDSNAVVISDNEEEDNDTPIVIVDDSDSESGLFVDQDSDHDGSPSPTPSRQGDREASVIPIPWSPSLRGFNTSSRTPANRLGSGERRRDSTSSGLFVSQSPGWKTPSNASVKSEDSTPVINPEYAKELIDLTEDDAEPPSPTGAKRPSDDDDTSTSPYKRPRTTSPEGRPPDDDADGDARAASI